MRSNAPLSLVSLLASLAVPLVACDGHVTSQRAAPDEAAPPPVAAVSADAPASAQDDVAALARGNEAFALAAYDRLRAPGVNVAFAPYSVSLALAMTYAGARGETASQIAAALRFPLSGDRLGRAFAALDASIASASTDDTWTTIAASLWARDGLALAPAFVDGARASYGAEVHRADFATDAGRLAVDGWVSDHTRHLIPELLRRGDVDGATALVLVDAIAFRGTWQTAFDATATKPRTFHGEAGGDRAIDMMVGMPATMRTARVDGAIVAELPFRGERLALTLVRAEAGALGDVEAKLVADGLARDVAALAPAPKGTIVVLPKETLDVHMSLARLLQSFGATAMFDDRADFSAMAPSERIEVKDVVHETVVGWDERGADASGATAVVTEDDGALTEVAFDRPFAFFLRDRVTGAILFAGRVVTP